MTLLAAVAAAAAQPAGAALAAPPTAHAPSGANPGVMRAKGPDGEPVGRKTIASHYIVSVGDRKLIPQIARDFRPSVRITRRYGAALDGFSAVMDKTAAAVMARDPRVVAVEQDQVFEQYAATQTAPPWGLDRIDQVLRPLDDTYNHDGAGRGVNAYVIDSGIMRSHTQFGDRVSRGFDALGRGTTSDCRGHGTHVAGTIGGATYGVAKSARLIPVRVLRCDGSGSASLLLAGLDYVARHHVAGQPAVVNMSVGGPASSSVDRAVNRVINDGVTVVAAAGNESRNACNLSPSRVDRVITVGATNATDRSPNWSNYGPCLDIFAPGTSVLSAGIASRTASTTAAGTSMAAPHVTGVAARYLGQNPQAGPAAVARHITATATPNIVTNAGYNTVRKLLHIAGQAPVALSQEASATFVAQGDVVTLRGVLRNAWSGVAVPGRTVRVYRRPSGGDWTLLTSRTTDSSGRLSVSVEVGQDTEFQLRHVATAVTMATSSDITSVAVDRRVGSTISLESGTLAPLTLGQSVSISGTLRDLNNSAALPGQPVELRVKQSGATTWTTVESKTTDAAGSVAFVHAPRHNSDYRLHHLGSEATFASASSITSVQVAYRVTSQASATTIESGQDVWITGRIEPVTSAGWATLLYRDEDGYWSTYEEIYYDANGNFAYSDAPFFAGTHAYQIVMPGDAWNTRSAGPIHTVSVWCSDYYC